VSKPDRGERVSDLVLAPFAGAGGGCLGADALGLRTVGIENDPDCCATRAAAGLDTIRADVTRFSAAHLRGRVAGLVGSPPCQDFSRAGRRAGLAGRSGPLVYERHVVIDSAQPAPTVVAGHGKPQWSYGNWQVRVNNVTSTTSTYYRRGVDRPSPTIGTAAGTSWAFERPATTVCPTARIAAPGHHDSQWNGSIPVTLDDLALLQSFPPGYPFVGNKTSVSRQIGNAFPPLFARAVIAAASGALVGAKR
jgi:site-specific DNA-cytosine methylase